MKDVKETTLRAQPYIALQTSREIDSGLLHMRGIVIGHAKDREATWGHITINDTGEMHEKLGLTRSVFHVGVLAACGLTNKAIGSRLGKSKDTVGAQMATAFGRTAVPGRSGLARFFLGHEAFVVDQKCTPFKLRPREIATLNERSYGVADSEAASGLEVNVATVKSHKCNVARRMIPGGASVQVLCAFASGAITVEMPSLYLAKVQPEDLQHAAEAGPIPNPASASIEPQLLPPLA